MKGKKKKPQNTKQTNKKTTFIEWITHGQRENFVLILSTLSFIKIYSASPMCQSLWDKKLGISSKQTKISALMVFQSSNHRPLLLTANTPFYVLSRITTCNPHNNHRRWVLLSFLLKMRKLLHKVKWRNMTLLSIYENLG